MAYVSPNFKSKAALKRALKEGKTVEVFQPNNMFGVSFDGNGSTPVEGPHFPEPHRWYGIVEYQNGIVTKVK